MQECEARKRRNDNTSVASQKAVTQEGETKEKRIVHDEVKRRRIVTGVYERLLTRSGIASSPAGHTGSDDNCEDWKFNTSPDTVEFVCASFKVQAEDEEMIRLAFQAIRGFGNYEVKREISLDGNECVTQDSKRSDCLNRKCLLDDLLRVTKDRNFYKQLDPAQDRNAELQWSSLLSEREITDSKLRQTHDEISRRFTHGDHAGHSVRGLISDFESGATQPTQLPALVGVEWRGYTWIIFGNRRLHACKEYARHHGPWQVGEAPRVRVITHHFACAHIRDERLRHAFHLKALQAMSTQNAGQNAAMRNSHWRGH